MNDDKPILPSGKQLPEGKPTALVAGMSHEAVRLLFVLLDVTTMPSHPLLIAG